jgi:hypothetical protein
LITHFVIALNIFLILSLISISLFGSLRQYLFMTFLAKEWVIASPASAVSFHSSPKLNQLMFHISGVQITWK